MRVLLQKVSKAAVTVEGKTVSEIGEGYLLFLCVMMGDADADGAWLTEKIANLRLWPGADATINQRSLLDVGGSVLLVSQFTLAARMEKGNRPDYTAAAPRAEGERLCALFREQLVAAGIRDVRTGAFGAFMEVDLQNSGPVTLLLERAGR